MTELPVSVNNSHTAIHVLDNSECVIVDHRRQRITFSLPDWHEFVKMIPRVTALALELAA